MGKDSLYEAMKVAAKKRKIKASPEHDLYKRVEPYFFSVFYAFDFDFSENRQEPKETDVILDIAVKYCRFDELRWAIISPNSDLKFTDKIRANSVAMCRASFPRKTVAFKFDGSEDGLYQLCEDILDWLEGFYKMFFESVDRNYGSLEEYYLANKEEYPLLAGLVYIERGQYQEAEECFRLPNMSGKNSSTSISPSTEEQIARVNASCEQPYRRSDYERLLDYMIAMQYDVKWTEETANYGLLPAERHGR